MKFRAIRSLAIALVLLGAGCSHTEQRSKMAIVVSTLNNPWFVVLGEAARTRAVELGFDATVFDSQNDTSKEAAHFENLIAGGYKAVLFNPTDSKGSVANARAAKTVGVPVFCIDREIDSTDAATAQLFSDSYSGCVALGQYFVRRVGKEGKYAELLGIVGDNNTFNRSQGFHSVVDRFPGLKMVAQQSADFDRAKALDAMESILQKNPDLNAVFCGNDAMAMGAYQALVGAGKAEQVKVFGFDGADDAVKLVAEGKIAATAMQFPKVMAAKAAEFAADYLIGQQKFAQKIPVRVELVTPENVSKFGNYGSSP
jgi:ribose transport system substrate-binding protein